MVPSSHDRATVSTVKTTVTRKEWSRELPTAESKSTAMR
jgi:hypothetical protein